MLVVQGARQVGKSTFAQMLVEPRGAQMFTLDDEETLAAARENPRAFVEQASTSTVVIDEVQRYPRLLLAIKAAVDRDRRPGRFVLTGSSNFLRMTRNSDSLAGRAVTVGLRGFSQDELAGRRGDFSAAVRMGADVLGFRTSWNRADYVAALVRGGYPVMRLLAANQAGELVKARIADQANIPATSMTGYLDVLETLFLTATLPPWTPNLTRREVGRAKAIVADPSLAVRLSRLTEQQLLSVTGSDHLGGMLEGFVVEELIKQRGWSAEEFEIFHFRDRNGLEVDIVIEFADGSILGLEVKASQSFRPEHFGGLKKLAEKAGDRFRGGIVLNTSDTGYQFAPGLYGLPVSALWEIG